MNALKLLAFPWVFLGLKIYELLMFVVLGIRNLATGFWEEDGVEIVLVIISVMSFITCICVLMTGGVSLSEHGYVSLWWVVTTPAVVAVYYLKRIWLWRSHVNAIKEFLKGNVEKTKAILRMNDGQR
jgi:hypothetical protein